MKSEWNSNDIIGNVHEIFKNRDHYNFEWRSFYNGWIEGRFQMLKDVGVLHEDNILSEIEFKKRAMHIIKQFKDCIDTESLGYSVKNMTKKENARKELFDLVTEYLNVEKIGE
jgi:hypothetical protein